MATAFDTFNQYAFGQYPGQLEDVANADIVSRLASGSDIGYGVAVTDTGVRDATIPSGTQVPTGITLRETVRDNPAGDNPTPVYPQNTEMSVLRVGRVWVTTVDGAAVGQPVYAVPGSGTFTNDPDSASVTAQAAGSNTGDGTIGSLSAGAGSLTGEYVAVCTATATDGGTFTVYDPDGQVVGEAEVGSAFDEEGIGFTISDGAADFVEGDRFYITVVGNNVRFPGAEWKSAASADELALVQV